MPAEGERIIKETLSEVNEKIKRLEGEGMKTAEEEPYRGPGWRAIGRRQAKGGLSKEQAMQFQERFSDLEVGSSEYRRLLQDLSREARKGRVKERKAK